MVSAVLPIPGNTHQRTGCRSFVSPWKTACPQDTDNKTRENALGVHFRNRCMRRTRVVVARCDAQTIFATCDGRATTDLTDSCLIHHMSRRSLGSILLCNLQLSDKYFRISNVIWKEDLDHLTKSALVTPSTVRIFELRLDQTKLENLPRRNTRNLKRVYYSSIKK
jgi:hypothetical protein